MREIWETAKYRLQCYYKSYTYLMPFMVMCVYLSFMYSVKPQDIISGYITSVHFLFIIMVWIGMSEINRENRVMEQIIELRVHKTYAYFAGKMLFFFILSMIMTTICTVWPLFRNVIENGAFFDRGYLWEDFLNSYILILGSAYSGAMLGALFHPDTIKDRKTAIALTVLFALLANIREIVAKSYPILKFVLWILPNVECAAVQFGNEKFFDIRGSLYCFCILMTYAVVYGIIGCILQYKRRQ
ncbi:MAG: hypothetical protein ACI4D4_06450 [Lachnospira sp.]